MSKTILIADDSRLVKSFLSSILQDAGYNTVEVSDGFEVIKGVKQFHPDCVVCLSSLPILSGFEVSRILKNSDGSDLPVILYSLVEENISKSVIDSCLCDDFFILDMDECENILHLIEDKLIDMVEEITDDAENEIPEPPKNEKELTLATVNDITKFYHNESEYLNIVNSIYKIFGYTTNLKTMGLSILDELAGFVSYDVAVLILRYENKAFQLCRVRDSITINEFKDFNKVCCKYFLDNCDMNQQIIFDDCIFNNDGSLPDFELSGGKTIKSNEYAVLFGDEFIGVITIGSTRREGLSENISRRFQFFTEKLSPYIMNVIAQNKMQISLRNARKAFSSFVPEEIIDDLIEKANVRTETAGEKRSIAVLVCDIRSFTTISERNKAEDVVSFLNSYFTEMVEIIKNHGGSIDKFMGDAIMALFGAPISYEDNAQRAVEAAIEMINTLPQIDCSRLQLPEGIDNISVGIGIHYGEVVLGSIGCESKKDYTVIGDSVNLASRLEGLTKIYGNHIIISETLKEKLTGRFNIHKLDKVAVKGKKIPVWVYSVEPEEISEEYHRNYDKGMQLYEVGAWALACDYFEKAIKNGSHDKAAQLMYERCQNYIVNPPEQWDGAVVLTSK